ncbi:MAG: hypothetical protein AB8B64_12735 [Granulosicoccus sp.]
MTQVFTFKNLSSVVTVPLLATVMVACAPPDAPSLGAATGESASTAGGVAAPLSDAAFNALPIDTQYKVVNKLLSSVYNGMPVDEFYNVSGGTAMNYRRDSSFTLSELRKSMQTPLSPEQKAELDSQIVGDEDRLDEQGQSAPLEARFKFDVNRPKQMPLARIFHYPISRDAYSQWMAWHLANTILFSPAEEIDSADITDVQNLFRRLDLQIMDRRSIRDIVSAHQRSVENWRRFRSPEDNTREMIEIYLGLFDKDDDVPNASQACRDLYLTDESQGYKLAFTDFPNAEPVLVLDQYVTNCSDFYDVIAGHPLLIPRVVSVLVDYFFSESPIDERLEMTAAITDSNPQTFEDVFNTILFSARYLLDTERAKSIEEAYLGTAKRMNWDAHPDVFKGMVSGRGALSRTDMREMGWSPMSFKLGRVSSVPLDSLSFGNYHKALRETLMLDKKRWRDALGLEKPSVPDPAPIEPPDQDASLRDKAAYEADLKRYQLEVDALAPDVRREYDSALALYQEKSDHYGLIDDMNTAELVDYLFLTIIERRATTTERNALTRIYADEGHLDPDFSNVFARSGRQDEIAQITFDYLSRLPETYYLQSLR